MLRGLFTPLKSSFLLPSPRDPGFGEQSPVITETPEDFARDAMIQLMRYNVEAVKETKDSILQVQILSEIHRILAEEPATRDVFRELDGFLMIITTLLTLELPKDEDSSEKLAEVPEICRLSFVLLNDTLLNHPENNEYFECNIGWDHLHSAVSSLVSNHNFCEHILGFALALSLSDFSISGIFSSLRDIPPDSLEESIQGYASRLGTIHSAGALGVLINFIPLLNGNETQFPYLIWRLCDQLASSSHWNLANLQSLSLIPNMLLRYDQCHHVTHNEREEGIIAKLIKRLLEMGASPLETRIMLQRSAPGGRFINQGPLDTLRGATKTKWPEHFIFRKTASLELPQEGDQGMPCPNGFCFMMWLRVESFPQTKPYTLFRAGSAARELINLSLNPTGRLTFFSVAERKTATFENATIHKGRWTHLAIVHHKAKHVQPSIRLFVDGILTDSFNWSYPRLDANNTPVIYFLGDKTPNSDCEWSLASAYLLSTPLDDELMRLVQHLGPRYSSNFQTRSPIKLLTYEAATSLNIHLAAVALVRPDPKAASPIIKALTEGFGFSESQIVFAISPAGALLPNITRDVVSGSSRSPDSPKGRLHGDVFVSKPHCLDDSIWEIGGPVITLRLVEISENSRDLLNSLVLFTQTIQTSWKNSEEVENIHGYEILAKLLRPKVALIDMAIFYTLFEFFGINFRRLSHSTVFNTPAYALIALDFEIWSHTSTEVQLAHLGHFSFLFKDNIHARFNMKQKLSKFGLVNRLLFALQTPWYELEVIPALIDAIAICADSDFSAGPTIKPLVSYIAAHLHDTTPSVPSPTSFLSKIDQYHQREKAELTFRMLVGLLRKRANLNKFIAALPVTRVCLLLLGEHPSPAVAEQVLILIRLLIESNSSFGRKFELVSGWLALRTILPRAWNPLVHAAAFDLLLGRTEKNEGRNATNNTEHSALSCSYILPAILASLGHGLELVGTGEALEHHYADQDWDQLCEAILEELINLQSTSHAFRRALKSHQNINLLTASYGRYAILISEFTDPRPSLIRIQEKLNHFTLSITLEGHLDSAQKKKLLQVLQFSERQAGANDPSAIAKVVGAAQSTDMPLSGSRLGLKVVVDSTLQKTLSRLQEWRAIISKTEMRRLQKHVADLRERHRSADALNEWQLPLVSEPGLWADETDPHHWRLDLTEGPFRVRKKLEPEVTQFLVSEVHHDDSRNIVESVTDDQSAVMVEAPPWAETYEFSSVDGEANDVWREDIVEDKHRRIRHELESGDVVEAVQTVTRIIGIDSFPGLLILGRTHIYMLDGLVENSDGEIIDARDAPKSLISVPGSVLEFSGSQRARRWPYNEVNTFSKRTCLFRDVALELYFRDFTSVLVVFGDKRARQSIYTKLSQQSGLNKVLDSVTPSALSRTPIFGKMSAKLHESFSDEVSTAQRRWQAREISNFTYLCILNQASGRTPEDATQYPVFPWILEDYTSGELDFESPSSFRDLTRPMGALTEARREAAMSRYSDLQSVNEQPFHYGTHFSSSMIVCHFLIRLAPFTNMFKTLQGGDWDLPDRLFSDVGRAYESASRDSRGDVRELIPEFFTCPEFLENTANLDFGRNQNTGEKVHNVKLPPWAHDDPFLFITLHRRALESEHVSRNLPAWIDLIWGSKQRDIESLNCFHPLSYEGEIDLDNIQDVREREAAVSTIHNFGQTPRKIFHQPHPARFTHGIPTLPIGYLYGIEEDSHLLVQCAEPVKVIGAPVFSIAVDTVDERILPCAPSQLYVPGNSYEQITWGSIDHTLGFYIDRKPAQAFEEVKCSCAHFADSNILVTGSLDGIIRFWRRSRPNLAEHATLTMTHVMRGHHGRVTQIVSSRAWSMVVSGGEDGKLRIWDLNRGIHVRSAQFGDDVDEGEITAIAIMESTGHIAVCTAHSLRLFTINARLITSLKLSRNDPITCLAFHEREYSRRGVLAAGGDNGIVILRTWAWRSDDNGHDGWRFETLRELKSRKEDSSRISAVRFVGESLFAGDWMGRVYSWDLPD